jgi:AraC-like DNA-binding protein
MRTVGAARLSRWNVDQSHYERTPRLAEHGEDCCTLTLSHGGDGVASGSMGWTRVDSGGGFFLAHDRPFTVTASGAAPSLVIVVERKALAALLPARTEHRLAQFPRSNPVLALIKQYTRILDVATELSSPLALDVMGQHIVDLMALLLRPSNDAIEIIEGRGLKAARLRQVLDRIERNACQPSFTIGTVAAELGVTARTVQLLLAETGSTFSEHVAEHRLRQAWRLLVNPGLRLAIAEVAYAAGYNDLANFHRAFRRRFGDTPAGVRRSGSAPH